MGSRQNFISCCELCRYSIFLLFLVLSLTHLRLMAEGRPISERLPQTVRDEKAALRAQIGSRPPRCEGRCSSCGHCEAIQVPTNPQLRNGNRGFSGVPNTEYARGDDSSNYKPMSWKCKCGNSIFNP